MKLIGNKEAIRSPEFHKQKEIQKRVKIAVVAVLVLLIIIAPIFILRSKKLQVADISIEGNKVTKNEDIERVIADDLSSNYLWVIPRSSTLLMPSGRIERDLLAAIPRLSSVDASLSGANSLKVAVTERVPYALYCKDTTDAENPSGCLFLDETGYIFSDAPAFSSGVYMVYASSPELPTPLREQYVPEDEFRKIDKFIKSIKALGLSPEIAMKKGDEYELTLKGGTLLKWKAAQNLENLARDLGAFMKDSKLSKSDMASLLYIDLRFENKVFYKFQGE